MNGVTAAAISGRAAKAHPASEAAADIKIPRESRVSCGIWTEHAALASGCQQDLKLVGNFLVRRTTAF